MNSGQFQAMGLAAEKGCWPWVLSRKCVTASRWLSAERRCCCVPALDIRTQYSGRCGNAQPSRLWWTVTLSLVRKVQYNLHDGVVMHRNTLTHTHPFSGPLSGTTRVSQYQKGKTNLDFTEARDSEWQWHQLGHMWVCTSLQTDNHASTHNSVFYRSDALPAAQPTASMHWRQCDA